MNDSPRPFDHQRLDAWKVSVELARNVFALAELFPRGHAALADQVRRAAVSISLNIAEGANKRTPKEKAHAFTIARGEVGEVAAALQLAVELTLVSELQTSLLLDQAGRVAAMLTRLIQKFDRRTPRRR